MSLDHELTVSFNTLGRIKDEDIERIVGQEGGDRGGGTCRDIHFSMPKAMSPEECGALKIRLGDEFGEDADFEVDYSAWVTVGQDVDPMSYDELTEEQRGETE